MFNARDLLGQLMQAAMTDTTANRMRHALGPDALAGLFGSGAQAEGLNLTADTIQRIHHSPDVAAAA